MFDHSLLRMCRGVRESCACVTMCDYDKYAVLLDDVSNKTIYERLKHVYRVESFFVRLIFLCVHALELLFK